MSPKEQAVLDMQEELNKSGKCFIAFHTELNPVMRKLVHEYISAQKPRKRHKAQIMAHCLFCHSGEVKYNNYSKYYGEV